METFEVIVRQSQRRLRLEPQGESGQYKSMLPALQKTGSIIGKRALQICRRRMIIAAIKEAKTSSLLELEDSWYVI
jgi:hypothetical protein